jgi:hypothetical protein
MGIQDLSAPTSVSPEVAGIVRDWNHEMKYVFVCGLHRSGTTLLAQNIGEMKNCTGFENTGALMDEGQHLQDVYPPDYVYGGVGKFGFAPQAHLTEDSPLLTKNNVLRLRQSWEGHWDKNKMIRIEKTPGNLLMTRFLQAAFPDTYFVVIKRHPVPVSLASQKWSRTSLHNLFEHWLRCHELFEKDKKYLKNLYELSYEGYVENPKDHLEKISHFIGTEFSPSWDGEAADVHNKQYFAQWSKMLQNSPFKSYYRSIAVRYEKRFAERGYSLLPASAKIPFSVGEDTPIGRKRSPLLFLGADIYSFLWDGGVRSRAVVRQTARRYCPAKVRAILRDRKTAMARRSA